jgi:two-component system, OmpR family, sensor histidine kinase KdpD
MIAVALRRFLRVLSSCAFIAALFAICLHVPHVKDTTVALLLVLSIVVVALTWGWTESVVAALAAGIGFSYFFLPPRGLAVDAPEDLVALITFLATAVTTSGLFTRARRARMEAAEQRNEMEKLYRLAGALQREGGPESMVRSLPDELVEILGAGGVALYYQHSGQIFRAGGQAAVISDGALREFGIPGYEGKEAGSPRCSGPIRWGPIRHGGEVFGSIGIIGATLSPALLDAVTGRIGMALAKLHAEEKAREAEIALRSQELKSAVLDALAHEIKNPLNSIRLAVSTLLSGHSSGEFSQQELLRLIDGEVTRLSGCLDDTVQTARLEADELKPHKEPQDMARLIPAAVSEMKALASRRPIHVNIPESLPLAPCDAGMIAHVLKQLVGNALKYSPADSPLTVSAEFTGSAIVMNVMDCGPGVAEEERTRIFDKYYRGRAAEAGLPGTGLGLASAKCIIQAHGGEIWVTNSPQGGAAFHVSLPVAPEATGRRLKHI